MYSTFKDNIWGADLADMQLMSKFLLCFNDIFSKYAWVVRLKDKKVLLLHFKLFLKNLIKDQIRYE